jgi:hypothetical protein
MRSAATRLALVSVIVGLTLLHAAGACAGPVVYNQPSVFPGSYSAWTSDRDASGSGYRSWDNFSLSQPARIGGVNWQGFYLDSVTPETDPVPDTTSWEFSFWSNAGGQPGVLLQSQTLPAASVQSTVVGSTTFDLPPAIPVTLLGFEAALTTPFLADPGTTYWLSVSSNSPTSNPLWSWFQGAGGDGITIQDQLPGGSPVSRLGDRAFSLEVQATPEPSTLAMFLAGIGATLGYGGSRRRRSRATR